MKFPSKKDWWMYFVFLGIFLAILSPVVMDRDYSSLWAAIPIICFLLWIWLTTYYVIEDKTLLVRSAFIRKTISIDEIKSIDRSFNPLSSPALSLDRLNIHYGLQRTILISPLDRDAFIEELMKRNPSIRTSLKR
ncbi:PH domain-containing protein [Peribacillus muralis]|uniref:PH domain-containing protein n=1 Tax=Peribacillus muralis TaxID=264697 RepID=UPI001F4E0F13|nr:PH domain-containing protein [Peribacillus muralis]MCK1994767.1 PH domain-containing protein [Peribacillus muralis]MCK2015406.1 PH domain-containing protein [Peribacillus muralis]